MLCLKKEGKNSQNETNRYRYKLHKDETVISLMERLIRITAIFVILFEA